MEASSGAALREALADKACESAGVDERKLIRVVIAAEADEASVAGAWEQLWAQAKNLAVEPSAFFDEKPPGMGIRVICLVHQ